MKTEIEKKSVMDKVNWLLTHNKNYTKEQMHTLQDLAEQLEQVCLMTDEPSNYIGRGTYDDADALFWEINEVLQGE